MIVPAKTCLWAALALLTVYLGQSVAQTDAQTDTPQPADQQAQDVAAPTTAAEDVPGSQPEPQSMLGFGATEAPREKQSFLSGSLGLGQTAQWNPSPGYATQITGDAKLLKYWGRWSSSLDYAGGSFYYPTNSFGKLSYIETLTAAQRFTGPTRELIFADSVGNSNTGGTFGSPLLGGAGNPGASYFSGGNVFGGGPVITNVAQAGLTQKWKRRSTIRVLGAYGMDFYPGPNSLSDHYGLGAMQYGYQLNHRSSIGAFLVHRNFQYPGSSQGLVSNVVELSYQRMLSRRLLFAGGAGPSFDTVTSLFAIPPYIVLTLKTKRIDVSAYGELAYSFKNGTAGLFYQRLTTGGSGLFAGANTNAAVLTVTRRISRSWGGSLNSGFAKLQEIQSVSAGAIQPSYQYWYSGATLSRKLGPFFSFFSSYQYLDQSSTGTSCLAGSQCRSRQDLVTIGLSWRPRPIRLGRGSNMNDQSNDTSDLEGTSAGANDPKPVEQDDNH